MLATLNTFHENFQKKPVLGKTQAECITGKYLYEKYQADCHDYHAKYQAID